MKDVIFCQYRETGVFQQRGFTLKQFMSQLFSNRNDSGKGRNMPVHYGGKDVNTVSKIMPSALCSFLHLTSSIPSHQPSQLKYLMLLVLPTHLR